MARGKFRQLTKQDRVLISHWKARGVGISQIALRVGVHKSTISRELRRNSQKISQESRAFWYGVSNDLSDSEVRAFIRTLSPEELKERFAETSHWTALDAQAVRDFRLHCAQQLRRRKKKETRRWVIQKLKSQWSPEQIAGRSRIDGPQPVSHEFVYQLIYRDRKRGGHLHRLLRRFGKRKQRFGIRVYPQGPRIPNRVGIEERPAEAGKRSRLGDLEGDLIVGYRSSGHVLTVVDRKSRFVILRKLKTKRKIQVRNQLQIALRLMGNARTLTLDNGSEFTDHLELTRETRVPVYFCHPYCSTERGTVENTNGLIRQYLPKGTCFEQLTQTELNCIQEKLNNRPRECLDFLTPREIHFKKARIPSHSRSLHLRVEPARIYRLK